jgi:hypothetical protein
MTLYQNDQLRLAFNANRNRFTIHSRQNRRIVVVDKTLVDELLETRDVPSFLKAALDERSAGFLGASA